ncbi:hypothetical protein [Clostridium sp. DSM 8431]|uniref:hypothetical protein n=1 Tax=Clostridium sp. DSM 8431 TaxID=1761781 RepID=UPI0011145D10|nr:hypothetical protein [Clostridium sp. DSM 8431]
MNDKIIKVKLMGEDEEITFSIEGNTTYNIASSQMYNMEHWLNTESVSIMVTCNNGNKVGLNKFNVQYAEILNI